MKRKSYFVLTDKMIELRGLYAIEKCPYSLQWLELYFPETEEFIVFLTSHLKLRAATIVAVYKDCWQIKIFFSPRGSDSVKKALKRNLKIKNLVGTNPNAVMI